MAGYSSARTWILSVGGMLLLYPLSFGPVSQMISQGYLPRDTWKFYQPMIRATNLTPNPLRKWTHAYYGWWLFRNAV